MFVGYITESVNYDSH